MTRSFSHKCVFREKEGTFWIETNTSPGDQIYLRRILIFQRSLSFYQKEGDFTKKNRSYWKELRLRQKEPSFTKFRYFTNWWELWQKNTIFKETIFSRCFFITYFHGEKTGKPWITKKTFFYQFFDTFSLRKDFFVKNNILTLSNTALIGDFVLFPQKKQLLNKRRHFLVKLGDFTKN